MSMLLSHFSRPSTMGLSRMDCCGCMITPCFTYSQRMGKKNRRKVEKIPKTPEHISTATNDSIRRQDRLGVPETTYSISQTIRRNVRSVQEGVVTRKHIARMLQYQVAKIARRTHDIAPRNLPETFVTPLTRLQHEALLPVTLDSRRHDFPHVLRYKVEWLAEASPADEPKNNKISVSFYMRDLHLSEKEMKKIKEVLTEDHYDDKSGIAILQGDIFDNLNANAHYLGDITEKLIRCVKT